MDEQKNLTVLDYLEIVLRRKWLILIPFLLSATVAVYLCATLPPIYRSTTTILVEPQQVPENYVQSTVTGSVQNRLATISEQILSRTMLESVIREFNLYPKLLQTHPMEEVVNVMRKDIEIKVTDRPSQTPSAPATFTLSYLGQDPETVQKVTSKLATLYIEENLRVRAGMARGTRDFLEKQLAEIEQTLKEREAALREFKERYMGELPEQLEANLRALDQLQNQRATLLTSLRTAEDRQVLLEQQLAEIPQYTGGYDDAELNRQIASKHQEIASLRARYTDQYPDVERVKNELRDLEQRLSKSKTGGETEHGSARPPLQNPAYARLKEQVDANRLTLQSLRSEIAAINAKMKKIREEVDNIPKREQELVTLTRDYESIKRSYDSMMARKINAEIAENLEVRQKSEQFRILDPPSFPEKPFKPNRTAILGIGLLVGLGLGAACAGGAEYLDRTFRSVEDVKAAIRLPVLEVIPVLATTREIRRKRILRVTIASVSAAVVILGILGVHLFVERIDILLKNFLKMFV